ncbi:MAG: flippase-like domain-containing protein [Candidatus Krumholzibacteriota bacterium]|nr:flippase-like domain-containing protein [Candidatus Krumholzibacteriota bacterium]
MEFLRKKWFKYLFQALGVALFVFIIIRIDLSQVWATYKNIRGRGLLLAAGIIILFIVFKSLRWKYLVELQGERVSLPKAVTIYTASLYLGVVTPGRIGDFAKSYYLVNRGMEAGKALFSSLLDRFFDICFLILIGYLSLLLFPGLFRYQYLVSSVIMAAVILVTLSIFWRRDLLYKIIERFVAGSGLSKVRSGIGRIASDILNEFIHLKGIRVVVIVLLTLAAWTLHYLFFIFFARALGIEGSVTLLIVSISTAIFVGLVPVSISGLGTRDMVLILIFAQAGLSREAAVSLSLAFVVVYLLIGLLGFICWLTAPFHPGREPGQATAKE